MEAWIYDEDRWPSGSAGGMATEEEKYQMKYVRCTVVSETDFEWPEERYFIAAFHAELEGLVLGSYQRIEYGISTEPSEGHVLLLFTWECMERGSFYNGNTYLDTMSRDAVENFLKITHDCYAEKCGDRMGKSIPGVFTDEPHRGNIMLADYWTIMDVDTSMISPWTPELPKAYAEAFGSSIEDVLPEVYFQKDGEKLSPHKWRYIEILQRLFLDNWAKPCLERSHQIGLLMTGHILHEDNLAAQVVPSGAVARYYPYMDIPGIDLLGNANHSYWVAKQVQSVCRQTDKPWIMSELYGCTGWQMGFDGHKRIGDWQALFGINLRCHHLSWYTMAGEAKRDYPASIFFQSPWWRDYDVVETYFSRLHTVLQSGKPLCDVLVVSPVESLWAQVYPGWARWIDPIDEGMAELQAKYAELFHWLAGSRVDFDYGDEDHISNQAKVVSEDGVANLELGHMRYRSVVVGGALTVRAGTLEVLHEFIEKGGHVVFAGDAPNYVDAVVSDEAQTLANAAISTPWSKEALVGALSDKTVSSQLRVEGVGDSVFAQIRELEDGWFVVLLNTGEEEGFDSVAVSFGQGQSVDQWDALSGSVTAIAADADAGGLKWQTTIPPLGERVFHVKSVPASGSIQDAQSSSCCGSKAETIEGPFAYELGEPNLLVLDYARLSIDGGAPMEPAEVLKIEDKVCEATDTPIRMGTMVQPWARSDDEVGGDGLPVELTFEFDVDVIPTTPCFLMVEQLDGKILTINGVELSKPDGWMIDPCFNKLAIPEGVLVAGRNVITLSFAFRNGVDIEALYLCGNFSVSAKSGAEPARVSALPESSALGDLTQQGLFFYGDRVLYDIPIHQSGCLEVEAVGASCVAFTGAGERVVVPWGDFKYEVTESDVAKGSVTCELILTRRNTFGPLHNTTVIENMSGPASFRTEGENWTNEYTVLPAGLTSVNFFPAS